MLASSSYPIGWVLQVARTQRYGVPPYGLKQERSRSRACTRALSCTGNVIVEKSNISRQLGSRRFRQGKVWAFSGVQNQAASTLFVLPSGHILQPSDNQVRLCRGVLMEHCLTLPGRFIQSPVRAYAGLVPHWFDLVIKTITTRLIVLHKTGVGGLEFMEQISRW